MKETKLEDLSKSLTEIENKSGPKMDTCRTLHKIVLGEDWAALIDTNYRWSEG